MDTMEFTVAFLEANARSQRESLTRLARSMAERLTRLADGLEADADFSLNALGELQGNGVEVDRLCGTFAQARQTVKTLRSALDERGA